MNKSDIALDLANKALTAIQEEINLQNTGRESVSNLRQLSAFQQELKQMVNELETGELSPPNQRSRGIGRVITDSWPFGNVLGDLIIRAETAYRNV